MKGYKTTGLPRASQMKSNRSKIENERFWQRQEEKKLRLQKKNAVNVIPKGNDILTLSQQEEIP